jgi:hypothetical protein
MNIKIPYAVCVLAKICDHEISRYSLGGVRVRCDEGGLSKATATDGRMLAQLEWKQPDKFEGGCDVIVPGDKLRWFAQDFFRKAEWLTLKPKHIIANEIVVPYVAMEGKWPDAEHYLHDSYPVRSPEREHCIDPMLLRKLLDVSCACDSDFEYCDLSIGAHTEAIRLERIGEKLTFRAAIMERDRIRVTRSMWLRFRKWLRSM